MIEIAIGATWRVTLLALAVALASLGGIWACSEVQTTEREPPPLPFPQEPCCDEKPERLTLARVVDHKRGGPEFTIDEVIRLRDYCSSEGSKPESGYGLVTCWEKTPTGNRCAWAVFPSLYPPEVRTPGQGWPRAEPEWMPL